MSSPWLPPRPWLMPPALPTVDWTADRASGLMAATWGAISPSLTGGGLLGPMLVGPRLVRPENGDEMGPEPGASSAAQWRSGGSDDGGTGRIWPVSWGRGAAGPGRPLSNGAGSPGRPAGPPGRELRRGGVPGSRRPAGPLPLGPAGPAGRPVRGVRPAP